MNEFNSYDVPITNKEEKGGAVLTQGSLAYSKQHNGFPFFFSLPPTGEAIFWGVG